VAQDESVWIGSRSIRLFPGGWRLTAGRELSHNLCGKECNMTADKFLALDLPGVCEQEHMGHPDFRVGGKIIATLGYPTRLGVW
jgi:hypothetical protein